MEKEIKYTITLTPKEVEVIILEKINDLYPEDNFNEINFNIISDPSDDGPGYSRQILNSIHVVGKKYESKARELKEKRIKILLDEYESKDKKST